MDEDQQVIQHFVASSRKPQSIIQHPTHSDAFVYQTVTTHERLQTQAPPVHTPNKCNR